MAYSTIDKPNTHFNPVLYTGNSTINAITGVGFQPDFIWSKSRTSVSDHSVFDVVMGTLTRLIPNDTYTEQVGEGVSSFDTDGFTYPNSVGGTANVTGNNYVAWNWKAGGTAVSNTDGSITSSVSANTTAGFSVVTWTGTASNATVGHGLGVVPKITIVKNRNLIANWIVGGSLIEDVGGSTNNYILLNSSTGMDTSTALYASYNPTTVGVKTDTNINGSGQGMVMYCFSEVKGYSKFGSYTGNGSADGTFVYTGFKPAFVMLKSSSSSAVGWITHDNKRIGFNPNNYYVEPNNSNAESADTDKILLLSNGFKLISTSASWNASGGSYIYMAFAEAPIVGSNNVPANAR